MARIRRGIFYFQINFYSEMRLQMNVPQDIILQKILLIRGRKVMLDENLALLYGVSTKRLNEQVKRNSKRFPRDFMFLTTRNEARSLRSQNGVGLIKSVDDVCHCKLISDATELRRSSTLEVIEGWKRSDCV